MSNWTSPRTWDFGAVLTAPQLNEQIRDNFNALVPVGTYRFMLGSVSDVEDLANGAWLQCNGASVLKATYSALNVLMSSLGYPFGSDSTHFNVPDFRGMDAKMQATSGTFTNLGDTGGQESSALSGSVSFAGGSTTAILGPDSVPVLDPYVVAGVWQIKAL